MLMGLRAMLELVNLLMLFPLFGMDLICCFVWQGQKPSKAGFQKKFMLIFICIPVSPGNSRLIWTFPRNVGVWVDKIVPRWIFHIGQNLILDSDLYLLHVQVNSTSFFFKFSSVNRFQQSRLTCYSSL